jgi:hypothetical protein
VLLSSQRLWIVEHRCHFRNNGQREFNSNFNRGIWNRSNCADNCQCRDWQHGRRVRNYFSVWGVWGIYSSCSCYSSCHNNCLGRSIGDRRQINQQPDRQHIQRANRPNCIEQHGRDGANVHFGDELK